MTASSSQGPLSQTKQNTSENRRDRTIPQILAESAQQFGERVAIVEGEVRLSFRDLEALSLRLAGQLFALGLRKGDVVAMQMPSRWHFIISHLALTRLGLVLTPMNLAYRRKEVGFMMRHNDVKAVIVVDEWKGFDHVGMMLELRETVPSLQHVLVSGERKPEGTLSLERLLQEDPIGVTEAEVFSQDPQLDDAFAIMFTSGTESDPKATLHTYRTFVPNHLYLGETYQVSGNDVMLCLSPLGHMFALPMITVGIRTGARQVLLESYSAEGFMTLCRQEGVTFAVGVPAQWLDILRATEQLNFQGSLRLIVTGGTRVPAQLVQELRQRLGCALASQWGMTEVCAGLYTRPDDPPERAWETVGRVCPEGNVEVFNEEGLPLPCGEVGELGFRGPSLFVEYYKNPAATEASYTSQGFFLTGDLVWLDEEGYVHFVGRKKDTINRGGLKVHTAELEEALVTHPKIHQVSVVAMPDERLGEKGCAFVTLHPGSAALTLEEVAEFLLSMGMAKYKIPERLEIRDQLPTTATGKVQKGPLRQEIAKMFPGK